MGGGGAEEGSGGGGGVRGTASEGWTGEAVDR